MWHVSNQCLGASSIRRVDSVAGWNATGGRSTSLLTPARSGRRTAKDPKYNKKKARETIVYFWSAEARRRMRPILTAVGLLFSGRNTQTFGTDTCVVSLEDFREGNSPPPLSLNENV